MKCIKCIKEGWAVSSVQHFKRKGFYLAWAFVTHREYEIYYDCAGPRRPWCTKNVYERSFVQIIASSPELLRRPEFPSLFPSPPLQDWFAERKSLQRPRERWNPKKEQWFSRAFVWLSTTPEDPEVQWQISTPCPPLSLPRRPITYSSTDRTPRSPLDSERLNLPLVGSNSFISSNVSDSKTQKPNTEI